MDLQTQAWQSSVSGGISTHSSIRGLVDDEQVAEGYYLFSGKALQRNNTALAVLMSETLNTLRFDEHERIRDIISQRRVSRERSVTGSGHTLAMTAASAGMGPVAKIAHQFGGLEAIRLLKSYQSIK